MRFASVRLFVAAIPALVAAGALIPLACSGQGEGERCDTQSDNNGTDDCAGNLVCVPAGQLTNSSTDRCCPADRSQATVPVCQVPTSGGVDSGPPTVTDAGDAATDSPVDSPAPVDSGDAGPGDAGGDVETDAVADGPTDAPTEGG